MNKVILTGRVVSEDYFKAKTTSGKDVLGFVIAVNNEYGGEPDFLNITAFGLQASNFEKYNKKGDLVEVIGKIKRNAYVDRDNHKQYKMEIVADNIIYSARKVDKNAEGNDEDIIYKDESKLPKEEKEKVIKARLKKMDEMMEPFKQYIGMDPLCQSVYDKYEEEAFNKDVEVKDETKKRGQTL